MASRRSLIADAIVAAVSEITIANGWPIDVVAEHAVPRDNRIAGSVDSSRHRVFLMLPGESENNAEFDSYVRVNGTFVLDLIPAPVAAAVSAFDALDTLLLQVQKRIRQEQNETPPFGVAGVEDFEMRWDAYAVENDPVPGATVTLDVTYRHNRDDPEAYG